MLRAIVSLSTFLLLVVLLAPLQLIALALQLPLRRTLPLRFHRMLAALLGLRVRVEGRPSSDKPLLILSNHVSWLDIVAISTVMPIVFVAKQEVSRWPLFGWLARMQRTIFVDRQRRHQTGAANERIAEHLIGGDAVVLFAEGTSSDGNHVLPFRTALVGAVHQVLGESALVGQGIGEVNVQPLSVAYVGWNGISAGRQFRPFMAWYGDMDLFPHLGAIASVGACDVVLTWGHAASYDIGASRKDIARFAESSVRRMTAGALREKPFAVIQKR